MTRRTVWMLGALVLVLLAGEWALLRSFYQQSPLASIECRANNAGTALAREDVRVLLYPTGRPWELVAEGHIRETLLVPSGRYDARLVLEGSSDRQSVWFRDLQLDAGARVVKDASFSAGELTVTSPKASGAGDGQLVVYVFAPDDHDQIITSIRPPEPAVLAAGTYDLRTVLSAESEERGVVWLHGVEVEAGARVSREVRFRRGSLVVEARNAGEILPGEAVALKVFKAGDLQEEVIDWGQAGTSTSLEPGRYDVELTFALSNDKPTRWLRGLEIVENETLEREVEFSSGSIRVDAEISGGEQLLDFQAYAYYYRTRDHREPVAYTPAGETAVLATGRYDIRVHFFRSHDQPDVWIRDVAIEAGRRVHHTATFPSGRLLVRAYDENRRELIGDEVFLYVYDSQPEPPASNEESRPLVVARSGEELRLTAGTYDLRLQETRVRGRTRWLRDVLLEPGGRNELSVGLSGENAIRSDGDRAPGT